MKKLWTGLAVIAIAIQIVNAQGTLYLSHPGSFVDTGLGVGSDFWRATYFETGSGAGGYSLNSIQLLIAGINGTPNSFEVSLYSNNSGHPGSSLASLSGSVPTGAGVYAFTASGVLLAPSTVYWVVATSTDSTLSGNTCYWAFDPNAYTASDGWTMDTTGFAHSPDGLVWSDGAGTSPATLSIYATAVPEPAEYCLVGLGIVSAILLRRLSFGVRWQDE